MIRVKLQEILDKEERSLMWVAKKTGISYATLHKFNSNATTSVSYNVLEKLCTLFNCSPNDILQIVKE